MKILVTGGMGYIGSHTCVELLNLGMEVVIVDNLSNANPEALNRVETITGKRPMFYELDVCDEQALSAVFDAHQIDCVIHFAGMKAVGESVAIPERSIPVITRCPCGRHPKQAPAPIPMAGRNIWASRSYGTSRLQIRTGLWCCCGTLTPWAPIIAV